MINLVFTIFVVAISLIINNWRLSRHLTRRISEIELKMTPGIDKAVNEEILNRLRKIEAQNKAIWELLNKLEQKFDKIEHPDK